MNPVTTLLHSPHRMIRVGELLEPPPQAWPDSDRPNEDGCATPEVPHPEGWPVYRVRKRCPNHGLYRANSFSPQYDDDAAKVVFCDTCNDLHDQRVKEDQRRIAIEQRAGENRRATGRPADMPRDPLDL